VSLLCKGWFPFTVGNDATAAPGTPDRNVKLPLACLTKAWWLARSFDYSISIDYDYNPAYGKVGSGTTTGSGTVPVQFESGGAYYQASPQQRVVPVFGNNEPFPPAGDPGEYPDDATAMSATTNGTFYYTRDPGTEQTETATLGQYLSWFINPASISERDPLVWKNSSGEFLSIANIYLPTRGGGLILISAPSEGYVPSAVTATIRIEGVDSDPIALWEDSGDTMSASGNVLFDFNNFWTP